MPDGQRGTREGLGLCVTGLAVRRGSKGQEISILEGVGFELMAGRAMCVTGRSGSGKSSLLEICAGLERPTEGHVIWRDIEVTSLRGRDLQSWRSATVAFLDQDSSMVSDLRLLENVLLGVNRPRKSDVKAALSLMGDLGIAHRADAWPSRCSGGERQRAGLARALLRNVPLIVVDEPTASLDEENARRVLQGLDAARDRGASILAATHDELVQGWADDALHL